jgi:hypothetical protein
MLYEVFSYAQRARVMALEPQVEEADISFIFSPYPELLCDSATRGFLETEIACTHRLPGSAVDSRHLACPRQHRGGAWKVAYADFVTALMALFIVLWMMKANEKVK